MSRTLIRWSALGALTVLTVCVLGCGNAEKYTVETKLLIIRKSSEAWFSTQENDRQFREDYVATNAAIIKSPTIINRALKQPNVKDFPITQGEDATWRIIEALDVRRDSDSKSAILTLSLQCENEKDGVAMLQAITKSYQAFLDETYKNTSDKTLELILTAKQTLKESLERAEQDYQDFRVKNPFLLLRSGEGSNIYAARLRAIDAKRSELQIKKRELSGRLSRVAAALEGKNKSVGIAVKANEWAARSGFDKLPAEGRQGKDALNAFADSLREEIEELSAEIISLDELAELEIKQARDVSNYEAQDERLRRNIVSNQALFESIVKRVNELGLSKDFGGYEAQIIAPPRAKKAK